MAKQDETRALVAKARDGDRVAFDELVEKYRPRLAARIRARIGPRLAQELDAEDLLQGTFLRAYETIGRFEWRAEDSFYRWLGGIAQHLIWNVWQKQRADQLRLVRDMTASGTSPSKVARRNERFDRLQEALLGLSPDHRKVIELSRIEGLKVKEIAERMGRSPEAVRKLILRALDDLKRIFGETESFHLPARRLGPEADHDPGRPTT
jgi:RNA polymerase sigma-70 factor (ECF subfamily)